MKKIVLSLVTLMVLGTSTGFCKSTPNTNRVNQPVKEVVVNKESKQDKRQDVKSDPKTYKMLPQTPVKHQVSKKHSKCQCPKCQKQSVKHVSTPSHDRTVRK